MDTTTAWGSLANELTSILQESPACEDKADWEGEVRLSREYARYMLVGDACGTLSVLLRVLRSVDVLAEEEEDKQEEEEEHHETQPSSTHLTQSLDYSELNWDRDCTGTCLVLLGGLSLENTVFGPEELKARLLLCRLARQALDVGSRICVLCNQHDLKLVHKTPFPVTARLLTPEHLCAIMQLRWLRTCAELKLGNGLLCRVMHGNDMQVPSLQKKQVVYSSDLPQVQARLSKSARDLANFVRPSVLLAAANASAAASTEDAAHKKVLQEVAKRLSISTKLTALLQLNSVVGVAELQNSWSDLLEHNSANVLCVVAGVELQGQKPRGDAALCSWFRHQPALLSLAVHSRRETCCVILEDGTSAHLANAPIYRHEQPESCSSPHATPLPAEHLVPLVPGFSSCVRVKSAEPAPWPELQAPGLGTAAWCRNKALSFSVARRQKRLQNLTS